ncbi:hypothetical protein Ddc_14883 [Ditylenchus destructor]|nr:hypothetical protein Ddc_14883 [Ditylenchus destructor]
MFFQRKKNVGEVLQKQKFVISLPSDVWSEILRYLSRAQLCRQIFPVNRQLYNLANSRHIVPTTHVIYKMYFQTADRRRTFFNVFKSKEYNRVRFGDYGSKELETRQLRKMPIPKPFIHFQQVNIWTLLGKSILKFLRDAKESFVGSAIHYNMSDILDNKDMRNQMHYLLQNVFQKPSYISVNGPCLRLSKLKVLRDGLPNDTIRGVLGWVSSGKGMVQSSNRDSGKTHLVLNSFPRRIILDMVQQIKDAFIDERLMLSDFVITFVASKENHFCLEGDHKFILNKISTNERLSFFTHNQFACKEWSRLGIDFCDQQFYDFDYPREVANNDFNSDDESDQSEDHSGGAWYREKSEEQSDGAKDASFNAGRRNRWRFNGGRFARLRELWHAGRISGLDERQEGQGAVLWKSGGEDEKRGGGFNF